MFKLQRLEITGFKSFADYTEIIFTGDGITAIVGPNGCGKSNVADAIAWVLGEQRVKHLRGGEMKDVIFQGSRNRPPSGMAEVVMHLVRDEVIESEPDIEDIDSTLEKLDDQLVDLDQIIPEEVQASATEEVPIAADNPSTNPEAANASETEAVIVSTPHRAAHKRHWRRRNLALEFAPGEAVTVTRRLYRSGESEYLLNDKICRLRDIQDLFSGTGLAGGHYAIIEQGRIGQILSAKPMDRRTIIEEAAGITKFRVRQRATEGRLESARSNLSRITDIVSEIDRQVNSLRRQAAKARRYGVLREELKDLLRRVYIAEDAKLSALLAETRTKLHEITELESGIAQELATRETDARAATQEARNLEDELSAARAAAAEAVLRRDREARERVYQQEQLDEIEKRRSDVTAELEGLTQRLALVDQECSRLQAEDARLREEADQTTLRLREAEEGYSRKLTAATEAEADIETARGALLTQTAIAERLREIARQLEGTLDRLSQQSEGLAREGERAEAQHVERRLEADRFSEELSAVRDQVTRLQAERELAVDAVVQGHEAVSDTEAELSRVRDEHSRASHRLESLKELDQRRAYYSPAVQLIFSNQGTRDFHYIGTLADALNVEAKWERAVEGVLGSSLQSIVVPTPDDAVRAAQWLRENNGGRASFLVAGLHGGSDDTDTLTCKLEERQSLSFGYSEDVGVGVDVRISDILGAPQQLITVLKRTLPQKMNARLARNLEEAMEKSIATGEMYVTLNGDWIASGQFINAGDARDVEEGAGLLAFKRELRELETRAEALGREVDAASNAAKDARARLVGLEDAVVLLNEAIGREEREAMTRELTAAGLAQEVERAERHMRVVAQDSARVAEERREIEQRRSRALLDAVAAEQARESAADNVISASGLLADLRREAEIESESLATQRAVAAAAAERRRSTTAELRRLEAELADVTARVERHRLDLSEMGDRVGELTQSIAYLTLKAESVESEREAEETQIAELSTRLLQAREQADAFASELSELNRRAAEVRDSRSGLEVQRAEAQARQTFVHENCQSELGQSLEDLAREVTLPEDFDFDQNHQRVEELRTRLDGFGAVNMMALEELAEAEERLLFLTVQRQDIIDGIASTEEALREIKRRSRERFRHAFEHINKNFSDLFQELFGGGRGEMSLIDADDILESGIDVIAQPPGKRLQNVLLLSGGEKAMAALALVLGIFHYRPAPFCLLDEVDAPLDEANVGRFTDKVVQLSANTQFIVITHNKRTMEMARALYGVTMEDAGVSKLVSVKFE